MPDHVHLFLNTDPIFAPSVIMKRVKGRASHHLRKEFPELLKLPTLWTPSYLWQPLEMLVLRLLNAILKIKKANKIQEDLSSVSAFNQPLKRAG
jgi:REP element-mobilizing transposase RayT